jgi:predicted AAA+ superfamily ATPase
MPAFAQVCYVNDLKCAGLRRFAHECAEMSWNALLCTRMRSRRRSEVVWIFNHCVVENQPRNGYISAMIQRNIYDPLLRALEDSPVVLLNGPRQAGKTTLVRDLIAGAHPARYMTLDDPVVLAAVHADAAGFIAGLDGPVVLDEIQRAPGIFVAIKAAVDRKRTPGRFLLTGSANVLLLPKVSESLAGRMEILTLWPLSQGEIEGVKESFVDAAFGTGTVSVSKASSAANILQRALRGGYPEVQRRPDEDRRRAWFGSYITTILQRDVRDIANIEGLTELPRLLALLAARSASLQNFAELSRSSTIPQSTLKRYLTLLESTYLVQTVRPWSGNLSHRLVKSPKLMLTDTGLMALLAGLSAERLALDGVLKGPLLENFVAMELCKQISWSRTRPELYHFRTQTSQEVDLVLEGPGGMIVGIEVKASSSVGPDDFKGLRVLASELGRKFHRGFVLYSGAEVVPFTANLQAVPISALWQTVADAPRKKSSSSAAKGQVER